MSVEHEQSAGMGQLGDFLRKQGMHAGPGGIAQRRNLLPGVARAAQCGVHRLQHPGGALFDDLREVPGGAFGVAQAGIARFGQGE